MLNKLRKLFGYKFPRLGKIASGLFFKLMNDNVRCELFPNIFVELNLQDLTQRSTFWMGDRFEYPTSQVFKTWGGQIFYSLTSVPIMVFTVI